MASRLKLNICHLYPDLMDTYGDRGNIIAITQRCKWRSIETTFTAISQDVKLDPKKFDIYFFGGGQDVQQEIVGRDLQKKAKDIKKAVEQDAVILSICGGYQLLQNYFKTLDGKMIKGIGLFDAHTIGSHTRMIQNLLVKINPDLQPEIKSAYQTMTMNHELSTMNLIGFENHSGKTFLGPNLKPLGTVIKGAGNNGEDGTEGAVYKNAFGCYLHGSLLPKNPHFADFLISKALERHHGKVDLKPLDDSIEWEAHKQAIKKSENSRF